MHINKYLINLFFVSVIFEDLLSPAGLVNQFALSILIQEIHFITLITARFRIRIRFFFQIRFFKIWSDPDTVIKTWSDPDPDFNTWSDPDQV